MILIKQMLEKNPMKRLSQFEGITKHLWFNSFNWEDLSFLNMKPLYFPILKSVTNLNSDNFVFDNKKNILYFKN